VLETASLNEIELGEYCCRKGLFPQRIRAWREVCEQAHAPIALQADREKLRAQSREMKRLEAEMRHKEKALPEAAALLMLQKKSPHPLGGATGRKIHVEERCQVIAWIDEAYAAGARLSQACEVLEISPRTLQRWREGGEVKADARQEAATRSHCRQTPCIPVFRGTGEFWG